MRCAIFGITDAWQWDFLLISRSLLEFDLIFVPQGTEIAGSLHGKFVLFVLRKCCSLLDPFSFGLAQKVALSLGQCGPGAIEIAILGGVVNPGVRILV